MTNYLAANLLFGRGNTAAPFWEASAIALLALGLAVVTLPTAARLAAQPGSVEPEGEAVAEWASEA